MLLRQQLAIKDQQIEELRRRVHMLENGIMSAGRHPHMPKLDESGYSLTGELDEADVGTSRRARRNL